MRSRLLHDPKSRSDLYQNSQTTETDWTAMALESMKIDEDIAGAAVLHTVRAAVLHIVRTEAAVAAAEMMTAHTEGNRAIGQLESPCIARMIRMAGDT
ncbi:MAG: hypothetical protein ACRDL7_12435, partial [Gaiellaceae bacterium]